MTKVYEELGKKPLKGSKDKDTDELVSSAYIGVEIELENAVRLAERNYQYWRVEGDGSLRKGGVELVMNAPYQGTDILAAFDEYEEALKGGRARGTQYCSTHVHMNFLSCTGADVLKFMFVYLLLEDGLARYCGPNRENNLFCLTVSNAEEQMNVLSDMYRAYRDKKDTVVRAVLRHGGQNGLKYSAMNLGALSQYGTIESRLSGALTTKDDLLKWVNILLSIRQYAINSADLTDVLIQCSALSPLGFVRAVLGDLYPELQEYFREEEVYDAIDRIQDIMSI